MVEGRCVQNYRTEDGLETHERCVCVSGFFSLLGFCAFMLFHFNGKYPEENQKLERDAVSVSVFLFIRFFFALKT